MKFIELYNIILESRLDTYKLKYGQELANSIFSLNDPKKQKMVIKWIDNDSIKFPQDLDKINNAYQIINRKGLDYQKVNSPDQILNNNIQTLQKINYNPDDQKCFTNKVQLGKGVVVYNVQNDMEGLKAVRKAVDFNWGEDAKPWCLIAPPLEEAYKMYWKGSYTDIPKRICFQNNKLIAFCASSSPEITWWDRNNEQSQNIPIEGIEDDPNAIKFVNDLQKIQRQCKNIKDPKKLRKLYQTYKDYISFFIVLNPNCPYDILQDIYQNTTDINNIICIAKHPNTPINILLDICDKKDDEDSEYFTLKIEMAEDPNTPFQVLEKLSHNENDYLRELVFKNPNWI